MYLFFNRFMISFLMRVNKTKILELVQIVDKNSIELLEWKRNVHSTHDVTNENYLSFSVKMENN